MVWLQGVQYCSSLDESLQILQVMVWWCQLQCHHGHLASHGVVVSATVSSWSSSKSWCRGVSYSVIMVIQQVMVSWCQLQCHHGHLASHGVVVSATVSSWSSSKSWCRGVSYSVIMVIQQVMVSWCQLQCHHGLVRWKIWRCLAKECADVVALSKLLVSVWLSRMGHSVRLDLDLGMTQHKRDFRQI